jgi:hypothetical protein
MGRRVMVTAVLQLDNGIELRTTDRLTCRALYRLMGSGMSVEDKQELLDDHEATRPSGDTPQ